MSNSFGAYNATVQSLLNLNLLNDNLYKKQIEETIINLIRNIKSGDMLLELEKAILTRNFKTNCVVVPSKLELFMCSNTIASTNNQSNDYLTVANSLFNVKLPSHIFSTRVWRWPDLNPNVKIKSAPNCEHRLDAIKDDLCINPYHYERLDNNNSSNNSNANTSSTIAQTSHNLLQKQHGTAASPLMSPNEGYSNIVNTSITHSDANLIDNLENVQNLNTTNINQFSINHPCDLNLPPINYIEPQFWCTISYYELNHHVGEPFHASQPYVTVDGFVDPSSAERFCLGVLTNVNRSVDSEQCRRLIGRGVRLYYIGGEIFAECLSENPIFVQSPICNTLKGWHPASVCRIPTGCNLKIFNNQEFANLLTQTVPRGYNAVFQLTRMCTIRLSFAKGWGSDYRRQAITSTPCWIEIRLNGPFQWLDRILLQMSGPGLLSS